MSKQLTDEEIEEHLRKMADTILLLVQNGITECKLTVDTDVKIKCYFVPYAPSAGEAQSLDGGQP